MSKKFDVFGNKFAQDVFLQKYSMNGQETWEDCARRVVDAVCGQHLDNETKDKIFNLIKERKFIPGGRYLYSAGRPFHQVNNCFLFRAEDSREGWADAMQKATAALMTGGGIGFDYSRLREEGALIKKTGGHSTGPIALMEMINESGRHIMQGGARRSAIWAGLRWDHPDIEKFMKLKDWSEDLVAMKQNDYNFRLPMEGTNISVIYDTDFFVAMENTKHEKRKLAKKVWLENCKQAFRTAEPGMGFNFLKDNESLRNACVPAGTKVLTEDGYENIEVLVGNEVTVWNGFEWSKVTPKVTGENQRVLKIKFSDGRELKCTPYHKFHLSTDYRGGREEKEAQDLTVGDKLIKHEFPIIDGGKEEKLDLMYTQGFYSADGNHASNTMWIYEPKYSLIPYLAIDEPRYAGVNQFGTERKFAVMDKRLFNKNYVPVEYNLQGRLAWLAGLLDGDGCELKEGGAQIGSIDYNFLLQIQELLSLCGVNCKIVSGAEVGKRNLPDGRGGYALYECKESNRLCIGAEEIQKLKSLGMDCKRLQFNKSPNRNASRFTQVVSIEELGIEPLVYCFNEPKKHLGIFNGVITGQCTEVTSEDDSDKCNLGTLWINRFADKEEFADGVKYATLFLLCGGIYSDVPTDGIREVGVKNNRIGLGLGGMHEWLMTRGYDYEVTSELHKWLRIYEQESDSASYIGAKDLNVSIPKGKRAIAPTGTIGILAETTTGIEPLFCAAYKRRYLVGDEWKFQYVVDGTVKRLLDSGIKREAIQDAYDISFKQRVKFQADVQNYVDMAISSTCNLPHWGSEENNEENVEKKAKILLKYAKRLRGFTCYPDGSRTGQPLERVDLETALKQEGTVFEEKEHECVGGVCGV